MLRAIQMRAKAHTLIRHFAQLRKTKNLEAAGVRKNSARPGHEFVQTAELANQLMPRPQIEMVGVRKNDASAEFFERLVAQGFYRGLRPHRHERWRFNRPMRRGQPPAPRASRIRLCYFKRKIHAPSVSGEDERPAHAANHERCPQAEHNHVGLAPLEL